MHAKARGQLRDGRGGHDRAVGARFDRTANIPGKLRMVSHRAPSSSTSEVDPAEIPERAGRTFPIVGDARHVLAKLLSSTERSARGPRQARSVVGAGSKDGARSTPSLRGQRRRQRDPSRSSWSRRCGRRPGARGSVTGEVGQPRCGGQLLRLPIAARGQTGVVYGHDGSRIAGRDGLGRRLPESASSLMHRRSPARCRCTPRSSRLRARTRSR